MFESTRNFVKYIKEAIADSGDNISIRSYSGRGMYGSYCVGVVTDFNTFTLTIAAAAMLATEDGNANEFIENLNGVNSDSMGKDSIYYWPNLKWKPEYSLED